MYFPLKEKIPSTVNIKVNNNNQQEQECKVFVKLRLTSYAQLKIK